MVIMVSIIKFRGGEINYLDSDATWHTLLTMQAYDETPISQHKFLPIVSLGGVDNKGIFIILHFRLLDLYCHIYL